MGKISQPEIKKEEKEYEQRVVDIARVTRIVAGGRRFRFRATVVVGDKNGKVGVGIAKGADVADAVSKAVVKAKKNFITVPIINETIPHTVTAYKNAARVLLKPAPKGSGIIAGGAVRAVVELAGIKNITSKALGSNSKINNIRATILALKNLRTPQEIAVARGKKLEELIPNTKKKGQDAVKESKKLNKANKK